MIALTASIGALLAWAFVGYPLLSALLARRQAPTPPEPTEWPPVALVIAARDEGPAIGARVANARALDYPALRVLVVSDGSSDHTVDAARRAGAEVLALPHVGKTAALEAAVAHLAPHAPPVVAFSDATAEWPREALRALVRATLAPGVGAASGLVRYRYPEGALAAGFKQYQALVVPHRAHDAAWGTLTSVSGSISAARWEVVSQPAGGASPPALSTDLLLPLEAARRGLRAAFTADAISWETARAASARELQSRVRLALSAYAFVAHAWRLRRELPWGYRAQLLSHKVLRWAAPALAVAAVAALAVGAPAARLPLAGLATLGAVTLAAAQLPALRRPLGGVVFAATVAAGYLVGLWRFARGQRPAGWDPSAQR